MNIGTELSAETPDPRFPTPFLLERSSTAISQEHLMGQLYDAWMNALKSPSLSFGYEIGSAIHMT